MTGGAGWRSVWLGVAALPMTWVLLAPPKPPPASKAKAKSAVTPDGAQLYRRLCASCHGDKGQGGPGYPKPLVGNRSVTELAKFIHLQMPPGPVRTPTPEAQRIAAHMHAAFYSPVAQERNRPARVEMSRLTVRQFRNAVSDLIGAYHAAVPKSAERGLRAEFFKGRSMGGNDRVLQRIDPQVNFDFGDRPPGDGPFDARNFSGVWQGSLVAPDTGEYELVVKSNQAVRLWFNGAPRPLADGWVRSASETEFRGAVTLLGGRAYPLRLEFTKATPGVDDVEKKKKLPVAPAHVVLAWRRPKMAEEPVPSRFLLPESSPRTFVVTTPLPADDRSTGYERGTRVSKEWNEATTNAALEAAAYVGDNLSALAGTRDDAGDRRAKVAAFARDFVTRAFRRPLTAEQATRHVDKQLEGADLEAGIKRVVVLALKSPYFLYRNATGTSDGFAVAEHLALTLWDSVPDPELMRAAGAGELDKPDSLRKQAERLADDPRAWTKLREFLMLWLKVDEVPDLVKSQKRYPDFDTIAASDLRQSLELFLEDTAGTAPYDYRRMMLGNHTFLNGRLAKIYGFGLPPSADFTRVTLDNGKRAGVLTQPYVLARMAYLEASSPIHRGVLVAKNMLGRTLSPPPEAFAPLAPSLHPTLTTRERVVMQTKPNACATCHNLINPLGFTLENFDAIGRFRTQDNRKPVDPKGFYQARTGATVKFAGAGDLAKFLADGEEARGAFVEKLFQNLVKQPILAYGPNAKPQLLSQFDQNRCNIRSLCVDIALTSRPK